MGTNKEKKNIIIEYQLLVGVVLLSLVFWLFFRSEEKLPPSEVKDADRIAVRINTAILEDALDIDIVETEWGDFDTEFQKSFGGYESAKFVIESSEGKVFYSLFETDSAAYRISQDYPELFSYTKEDGRCVFKMSREQNYEWVWGWPLLQDKGHTVVPSWLLAELLDRELLKLPETVK